MSLVSDDDETMQPVKGPGIDYADKFGLIKVIAVLPLRESE